MGREPAKDTDNFHNLVLGQTAPEYEFNGLNGYNAICAGIPLGMSNIFIHWPKMNVS